MILTNQFYRTTIHLSREEKENAQQHDIKNLILIEDLIPIEEQKDIVKL